MGAQKETDASFNHPEWGRQKEGERSRKRFSAPPGKKFSAVGCCTEEHSVQKDIHHNNGFKRNRECRESLRCEGSPWSKMCTVPQCWVVSRRLRCKDQE